MRVLLEVCVDSAEGLARAIAGGADRIELCSALPLGGLTPTPGLMRRAADAAIPVYAMIRPQAGLFRFDPQDESSMLADIDAARGFGLAGVVLGANREDGCLDEAILARLTAHATGLGTTLHRAFDLVPDRQAALETAVALGFERILTSGGALKAPDALDALAGLSRQAAGRISVMPGSGIRPDNVAAVLKATGAVEVHGSCSGPPVRNDERAAAFGFASATAQMTDIDVVRAMRAQIDATRE